MGTRVLAWPASKPETGNPYTALLAGALERRGASVDEFSPGRIVRGRYDVWHLHWPERVANRLLRVPLFVALVLLARARRMRLVWTVHNVEGHLCRHPRVERGLMRWLSHRLDGIVALSAAGAGLAQQRYPALDDAPTAVVPHGHYVGRYRNGIRREVARVLLQLAESDRVIVFVGRIETYKGVDRLVGEFTRLPDEDVRLVVAGEVASPQLREAIEEAAGADGRVRLFLDEVTDEELQVFLNAADLVALPYERILNSGSALLALSFGRPVLVPAAGAMADLQEQLGSDAVRLFDGQLTAGDLTEALACPAPVRGELIARVREAHDWDAIAEQTLSLYEETAA
jgi:glycosyltransferase involved in cell wall biosynthesis